MAPRTFICYSRKDGAQVDRLTADLKARGVSTWRDIDDIPGHIAANSQSWRAAVQEALDTCDVMLVALSPNALASSEVEAEWNEFVSTRRPVFPVLISDCDIPYRLKLYQVWDVRSEYPQQVARLAAAIGGRQMPAPRPTPKPSRTPREKLPTAAVFGALGLLFAILAIVGVLTRGFGLLDGPGGAGLNPEDGPLSSEISDSPGEVNPEDFPLPSEGGDGGAPQQEAPPVSASDVTPASTAPASSDLSAIGRELWRFDLVGEVRLAPTVGPDGTVYLVTHAGVLYAIAPDGSERWSAMVGGASVSTDYTAPVLAPDGRVYIVYGGELQTFAPTGNIGWTWSKPGEWGLTAPPAFSADGTAFMMTNKSSLWAISGVGQELWGTTLCQVMGGGTWPGPAVGTDGTVYAVCHGEQVYALDAASGDVLWTYDVNDKLESTPAAGPDGLVYVASDGGWVLALQPDGTLRWRTSAAGRTGTIQMVDAPVVYGPDGGVYVAPRHGTVYALDALSGEVRWTSEVGGQGIGINRLAVAEDGSVYARNLLGALFGISPQGEQLWRIAPPGDAWSLGPPATGPDGRLYVGMGTQLVAFDTGG